MLSFIKQIEYSENSNLIKIARLIGFSGKIGVFGGGGYAFTLINELRQLGVQVDYCVVDDAYRSLSDTCNGVRIYSVYECNSLFDYSVLIVGFGLKYTNEAAELRRIRQIIDESIELMDFEDQYLSYFYYLDYAFVLRNGNALETVYNMLEDSFSKQLLVSYVNGRINGNLHEMGKYVTSDTDNYSWDLLFSGCRHVEGTVIDCGAFDGKTALQINNYLRGQNDIIAMESDRRNFRLLSEKVKSFSRIRPINKGVWNSSTILQINGKGEISTLSDKFESHAESVGVPVVSLSEYIHDKVACIVMDIEGAELEALRGAEDIIRMDHPSLAIRIYHKPEDLFQIPSMLNELSGIHEPYRFFIRYNCLYRGAADLTFYAI